MKVYVLMGHVDYEEDYIVSIHLSKSEAEAKIWNRGNDYYSTVEEHEVLE